MTSKNSSSAVCRSTDPQEEVRQLRRDLEELRADHEDLQLLYEATIEHGEAVEDQLAEYNILLTRTQERLEAELRDAGNYLHSILPDKRSAGPRADWLLVPSTELGGDSFGYHDLDEDHFAIYLIDVCGHGVGAALLSVAIINVLRTNALAATDFRDPPDVLAKLNNAFPMDRQNNMFFTIWYGVFQRSTGRLFYASGGHPAAIHLRRTPDGEEVTGLGTPDGMVIGALADMPFDGGSFQIQPGDRLLVISDGTYEIEDETGATLTWDRLAEKVRAVNGAVPRAIYDWLAAFNHTAPLPDDFSMVEFSF
ncbi:PP2C family protein-serine/threonine phosphatase [Roseibium marinum]|uniref:Serine phosphatase RsbU (Regulator of sigma subunit) n=1 Tax=Roseibium marinum TaxID=281252 RepID=A0A2S3V1Z1_9HYPH|nr:SpoIIE family protein phosphatase [Roseibium marinum]POF33803.1 serine phosphatase RsbU (regulator of sigma subunit) [Roseibium marinum]